jgi:hypothetical protein
LVHNPTASIDRRRAAQAERAALAQDRWRRFQAASLRCYGSRAARRPSRDVASFLARAKTPGRMLLLARSGVWDPHLDHSLGSIAGPAATLGDYVRAGPNAAVQARALFDQNWYLARASGLAGSQWAPLAHYLAVGDGHNLSPHPLLDAPAYRARHGAKMAAAHLTALQHFLFAGAADGADPHPLFDVAYYVGQSEAVAASGENPLVHYLRTGWREGLEPHPLFAGGWYLEQNPDIAAQGVAPLLHYVTAGAGEGRAPHPLFETGGYLKQTLGRLRGGDPLSDFLLHGARELKSPTPHFQPAYYLGQVGNDPAARLNPLLHYLTVGAFDGLWPAPDFDEQAYFVAQPDAEPSALTALEHWARHRTARPSSLAPAGGSLSAETLFQDLRGATAADATAYGLADYATLRRPRPAGAGEREPVRVIAIRHTTKPDWVAVARALPNYRGQVQPRLPADGFTDPVDPAVLRRDVDLAERYGLAGFCHRTTALESLETILAPGAPAFPFCLLWTGSDGAAAQVVPVLRADHALRVDGRPILLLSPSANDMAWRAAAQAAGVGELFLIRQGGGDDLAGFDALLADPFGVRAPEGPPGPVINPDFRGLEHDYAAIVREQIDPGAAIPCVVAAHDTTPRSQDAPTVWHGASPGALQAWLEGVSDAVRRRTPDQRLVFLHAWNDWETGAALAPDLRFGHGWLEAVANAADADLLEP